MTNYIEQVNGFLTYGNKHIPPVDGNRDYARAVSDIADGTSTIDLWSGSQREADYISSELASDWKANRAKAVSDSTVTVDGMAFDGDEISQGRMARAVVASSSDAEQTVWVLADNSVVMATALQLRTALKLAGQAQTALWIKI
tara:strand:+ start:4731 stop:5159 length:429 start_codon:yes stop_codon:yes gene_type:complete